MTNGKVTIRDVYEQIDALREDIKDGYVTKDEFRPVRMIVYGLASLILVAVATALVARVVIAIK